MTSDKTSRNAAEADGDLEVEIKLVGAADELAALFESLPGKASDPKRVVSAYFDTADDRIWRRGYALRLRDKGGRHELTLKKQGGNNLERGEWTSDVPDGVLDIGLLPEGAPRREIGAVLPEALSERFRTEIDRAKKILSADGADIEVACDTGMIVSGDRDMPVAEVEFELLQGETLAMLRHIRSLLAGQPLAVSTRSKAERGRELAEGIGPSPLKAQKPRLKKRDTVEAAFIKVIEATLPHVTGNLAAAADGRDPEGVHQLRVALRRLWSMWSLFDSHLTDQATAMAGQTKRFLKSLGPARDLDVFLLETLPPVANRNRDSVPLQQLTAAAEARRVAAYEQVRATLNDPATNLFLLDLMIVSRDSSAMVHDGADALRPMACAMLQKRHKKVLKLGKGFADLSYADRHRVRIALKRLRYACDYFQTLYPGDRTRTYLKRLSRLQDDLGRLNDATVAAELADTLAADSAEGPVGAALIKGWYEHRLQTVEPFMLSDWHSFAHAKPFWKTS